VRAALPRWIALAAIVALAFTLRLSLGVAQLRTSWFPIHGTPIYAGWAYNLAAHGRFDFVEQNMEGAIYAEYAKSVRKNPVGELPDPADIIARYGDPKPAATSTWGNKFQPGYSVFMALVWAVTHDYRFSAVMVAAALLDSLTCLLVYWLCSRIWGRRIGLVGALGYALFVPQADLATLPLYTALIGPMLVLVATVASIVPRGSRRRILHAAAAGATVGISVMIAAPATLLAIPVGVLAMWRMTWRHRAVWLVVATLVGGLVLFPWSYRSWRLGYGFRPTGDAVWYNLYWGLIEQHDSPFGNDAAFGWPRSEPMVYRHFGVTRPLTPSAEAVFRPQVLKDLAHRPDYFAGLVAGRFASILLMSGENPRVERSLYTLGEDATLYAQMAVTCYRLVVEDPAALDANRCDAGYLKFNPWPTQTHGILRTLIWINHPLRVKGNGIGVYHSAGDASFGLPLLALLGFIIGWRRSPATAAAFAVVPLTWAFGYSINHIDPRYVAGAQAMFWAAACCGAASGLVLLVRKLQQAQRGRASRSPALAHDDGEPRVEG
jgi:4-amino-4-deoxy-L-arabinose transferase-like glycosyltransferase